ncbi:MULTISPECIES: hypothetical protein [Halolamina]|uniref:Putative restriction endonuclease n=1 Tax=Halolamina pelagica TaxID=699431 RepID=A0A1I5SM76_9EURY|nr:MULTISPECIES: hypothetical protein [Halolamina]NHX36989.1 hypothetical protein [Halolamina sp. R1-12]SFP71825.1 putative restriction endonuclease [Halolamina pelagica]
MGTWLDATREELHRYRIETGDEVLTLQEFYRFSESSLAAAFPENNHVRDKMRQQLQELRERDELTFLDDDGSYRIEDLALD